MPQLNLVSVSVVYHLETTSSILVSDDVEDGAKRFWLPKNKIEYEPPATTDRPVIIEVQLPEWLAQKEGLI